MTPLDRLEWLAAVATDQRLSGKALRLAMLVASNTHQDGRAILSRADILGALPVSKNTILRAQLELEQAGWLAISGGRGRGNAKSFHPQTPEFVNGKRSHNAGTFSSAEH